MRFLILLMVLCSTVSADDIFKPTGRYAIQQAARQWYLVSEPYCVHCPAAKAKFLANGWPESNILTVAECKDRFGFCVPRVPYEFPEPQSKQSSIETKQVEIASGPVRHVYYTPRPQRYRLFFRR